MSLKQKHHSRPKLHRRSFSTTSTSQRIIALVIVALFAAGGLYTLLSSHAAVPNMRLFVSPTSQNVPVGSNVTMSIMIDTGGASVNTVQSVLTYSTADFSLVSITPGSSFGSFPTTASSGSIQFAAAATGPVTGIQTVATVTFQAIGVGSSSVALASVCPIGSFALTCSAAYDSSTSANDLGTTNNPISNGTYTVVPVLPTTPTSFRVLGVTTTSVTLAWTASTDAGGPGLAGYYIYLNGSTTPIAMPTGTSYIASGLTPGTSYTYTIAAHDMAGNTSLGPNPSVNISTVGLPTTPTNFKSTGSTAASVSLSWTASTDPGGPGIAGYHLYRNGVLIASPTGTTYTDSTGLVPGTSYTYTIAAYDAANNTSAAPNPSATISTTTIVGDIDNDGHVTGHDLSLLLAHYGTNYPPAEFDGVTVVEGHDLSLLMGNYGT